jgi:peroxiredoxin
MKLLLLTLLVFNAQAGLQEKLDAKAKVFANKAPEKVKKMMSDFNASLVEQKLEEGVIKVGERIPRIKVRRDDLRDILKNGPVILHFYRGGWCPYCMLELKEYQKHLAEIKKKGARLIVMGPDTKLQIELTKRKHKLTMDIYRDEENKIAKKLGLVFKLSKEVDIFYRKKGINLKAFQGNDKKELPMPGTFVIDKKGVVRFAYAQIDYKTRAEPTEVIKAIP